MHGALGILYPSDGRSCFPLPSQVMEAEQGFFPIVLPEYTRPDCCGLSPVMNMLLKGHVM